MSIRREAFEKALRRFADPPKDEMESARRNVQALLSSSRDDAPFPAEAPSNRTERVHHRWMVFGSLAAAFLLITLLILTTDMPALKSSGTATNIEGTLRESGPEQFPLIETVVPMTFDAASIRPRKPNDDGVATSNITQRGGHVIIRNASLRLLILQAYALPSLSDAMVRILEMPDWGDSEDFDIEAVAEGNPTTAQKRLMLQSLLADRFSLRMRLETRNRPVYALIVADAGRLGRQLRLHDDDTRCNEAPPPDVPATSERISQFPCGRVASGLLPNRQDVAWASGRKMTMDAIAASIGGLEMFDRPIINRTSLAGEFDFTIEWQAGARSPETTAPGVVVTGVTLVEALRQQLGLRIVAQSGSVEVLLVDHVERPKPN